MNRIAVVLTLTFCSLVDAAPMRWGDVRDGSLYLQPARADTLRVSWVPAWQTDANEERIYLLDGEGRLRGERFIPASEGRGEQKWALPASAASYRVEVPGYSFRRYRFEHDDKTVALFAPTKVHFSAEIPSNTELYFKVRAGEHAILAGKFFGGVNVLVAERLGDGTQLELKLQPYKEYPRFDRIDLPVSEKDQSWRLRLQGRGKAAFWLDGTANLFAQRPQHLQPLRQDTGHTELNLQAEVLGPTPRLGVALPYVLPPPSSHAVLDALKPAAGAYYSAVDILATEPHYEDAFRRFYLERGGIDTDITLLAASGRKADLQANSQSIAGLNAWLATTVALGRGTHYLSFADEPNYNYPDYATYKRFFEAMSRQVRDYPGAREAGVRIAMPASSRFVNGPFIAQGAQHRGIDWARRLLKESEPQIDALAWHEWMIRDLLATRVYRDSVRQAAQVVGLEADGRPRKALLLDQTNISSGSSVSPYEQETHFASLWWASVAINSAQDGLLDMLAWFQAADDPHHLKGMIRMPGPDRFELKPVGLAQQFIQSHWLDQVQRLDNSAFEVDALAMVRDRERSVLGVNKGVRLQQINLQGAGTACPSLALFGPDSRSRAATVDCRDGRIHFEVPGETLFALRWRAS
ncbi:hypothetical protein PS645_01795 [Pseudomonas fluorescens]|uniref:Uncharacterized protein n=1 Tax=Pseudomonas fluorescens TaxID=294 RepID=A0A5E6RTJ3_PSEFL|nr:hypothetical protein [Pseudomonas fluorescens]VVM71609.1 hypothetical protein PS645_01795 [Pseudomonas fluorescens]